MFYHPKYYKELRKRNKELSEARPCDREAALSSNSDQVISSESGTPPNERAPGPGYKSQATSSKRQAASHKRQASSSKLR
jgi:hypothetical protein